jgi:hypothetical protein
MSLRERFAVLWPVLAFVALFIIGGILSGDVDAPCQNGPCPVSEAPK